MLLFNAQAPEVAHARWEPIQAQPTQLAADPTRTRPQALVAHDQHVVLCQLAAQRGALSGRAVVGQRAQHLRGHKL